MSEYDVCMVGGGIVSALMAQHLLAECPHLKIVIVDAGRTHPGLEGRSLRRQRMLDYGENPWPGDFLPDQLGEGFQSPTMTMGGWALHWSGNVSRFSAEDFRLHSLYGLATDWPLTYQDLEPWYCLAERRIGVSGEESPFPEDYRSEPYPMPGMPLSYSLKQIKTWGEATGIPFMVLPQAKNSIPYDGRAPCLRCDTCHICPSGARYSPDFTLQRLVQTGQVELHDHTLIRRLVLEKNNQRVEKAIGMDERNGGKSREYRARVFVIAGGRNWTPPLLLLSACSRFPDGLANSSGLVGKYIVSQDYRIATVEVPHLELYPGMSANIKLATRQFYRCPPGQPYVRHDLYLEESEVQPPRLRDDGGQLLLGDTLMARWREDNRVPRIKVGIPLDIHPVEHSRVILDSSRKNRWGDPLPKVSIVADRAPDPRRVDTNAYVDQLLGRFVTAGGGRVVGPVEKRLTHFGGGCRMGDDPHTSVCNSYGQTHDHDNLYTVGAASLPTGGCAAPTLTYVALALRSVERIKEQLRP